MADYLPRTDEEFDTWLANFHTYVTAHQDHFGLLPADMIPLDDACTDWTSKYTVHVAAQNAANMAKAAKVTSRTGATDIVRPFVRRLQSYPATTNADREAMHITVPGQASTSDMNLGPADCKPIATIDIGNRLKHVLRVQNQTNAGVKSGRPGGTLGAEIWRKFGEAPASDAEMQMVGIATRTQFVIEYPIEDGGKQVNYMMRWVDSKGNTGSWSETVSATVAA